MYLIFDLTSCIVLSLCLCLSPSLFWISFDSFSTVISPSIFLGVWMGGEQLSAITVARPVTCCYSRGELFSLRPLSPVQPCLDVRQSYTIAVRPRGRRAERNLQRPITVRITSRDRRVIVNKHLIIAGMKN